MSLFNGMGGAFMALEMSGFDVVQKISSKIDKYAIKANDTLFDDTIQMGDVSKIAVVRENGRVVGLMNDKGLEVRFKQGVEIMVCGGSPCQSFSFSGKRKGMATKDEQEILTLDHYLRLKSEDYEFEGQSYLFWEFVRLRDEIKPNYWFLENVEMGEKWEKVLSRAVGVNGVHVNSALLSAQNRKRIYWINFGMEPMGLFGELGSIINQPKDKGILLKDVLESDVDEKYYLSDKMINGFMKHRERHEEKGTGFIWNPTEGDKKASCLRANGALAPTDNTIIVHNTLPRSSKTGKGGTGPLSRVDGKTYCLDTGCTNAIEIRETLLSGLKSKDKRLKNFINNTDLDNVDVAYIDTYNKSLDKDKSFALRTGGKNDQFLYEKKVFGADFRKDEGFRVRPYEKLTTLKGQAREDKYGALIVESGLNENQLKKLDLDIDSEKCNTLTLAQGRMGSSSEYMTTVSKIANITHTIRRLTPKEAMRLQTVPEHYIDMLLKAGISETQLYRMTGNGWTIEVISYLFNYIK